MTHTVVSSYPIIEVIEEAYEIPQLNRKRRIAALLPYDYHSSDKRYPVLYLKDGQNLFDEQAPFGNWAVDKSLERLAAEGFKDVIIISIDHGGNNRITEYLPFFNHNVGDGEGKIYMEWMLHQLIPKVNERYRTFTGAEHTGIGGSSMGGLISLYAGLNHQDVFSKVMVFSPSLWIAPRIFQEAEQFDPKRFAQLYIYAGGRESANHMPNVKRLFSVLSQGLQHHHHFNAHLSINPEGTHSEYFWGLEFPKALKWLYF